MTSISVFFEEAEIQEYVTGFIVLVLGIFVRFIHDSEQLEAFIFHQSSSPRTHRMLRPAVLELQTPTVGPAVLIQSESRGRYEMFCVTCT